MNFNMEEWCWGHGPGSLLCGLGVNDMAVARRMSIILLIQPYFLFLSLLSIPVILLL